MGTSNFYNKNASKVYAICMDYERAVLDDDGNETTQMETYSPDEYEIHEEFEFIRERAEEKYPELYDVLDKSDDERDRNFHGSALFSYRKSVLFANVNIDITLKAVARSGYYEGANLDYELIIYVDGSQIDSADDFDFDYVNTDLNKGMQKIQTPRICSKIQSIVDELSTKIEEVFTEVSMPLNVVARMSNGETIYAKAQ